MLSIDSFRGPSQESVESAKKLCYDLISEVRRELEIYKRASNSQYNQKIFQGYSSITSSLLNVSSPSIGTSNTVLSDASSTGGLYAYYYQYYFASLGGAAPSESVKNDPSAASLELQQRQQYAAYYATIALNSAVPHATPSITPSKQNDVDPFMMESPKNYKSVPPPPNLYK